MFCKVCGNEYKPKRPWQQFCRTKCRQAFHAAERAAALRHYQQHVAGGGNGRNTDAPIG